MNEKETTLARKYEVVVKTTENDKNVVKTTKNDKNGVKLPSNYWRDAAAAARRARFLAIMHRSETWKQALAESGETWRVIRGMVKVKPFLAEIRAWQAAHKKRQHTRNRGVAKHRALYCALRAPLAGLPREVKQDAYKRTMARMEYRRIVGIPPERMTEQDKAYNAQFEPKPEPVVTIAPKNPESEKSQ